MAFTVLTSVYYPSAHPLLCKLHASVFGSYFKIWKAECALSLKPSGFLPYAREAQEQAGFHSIQLNTAAGDFSDYILLSS